MVASEEELMRELIQQQQMIEALLATQRNLMQQRDSLSDDICKQMSNLWSDVSSSPCRSKKKRGFEPANDDDIQVAPADEITYRSMGEGIDLDNEISEERAVYRSLSISSVDLADNLETAGSLDEVDADDEATWLLKRRVEILSNIKSHLEQTGDWNDAATATGAMERALQLSDALKRLDL